MRAKVVSLLVDIPTQHGECVEAATVIGVITPAFDQLDAPTQQGADTLGLGDFMDLPSGMT